MNKEQELIARISGGDHEAFRILVTPLLSSAYKSAYLILRSKEHAQDALQNALEGAFVSMMKKKDITNFKAWFYTLVYSRSIDLYQKNNRQTFVDYEENREAQLKIKSKSAQQIAIHISVPFQPIEIRIHYKSVKWLVRIEAIDHVHEGYW